LYFFRDNNGNEVDLLYQKGRSLVPIEIKASRTWNAEFLKGIRFLGRTACHVLPGAVIYSGELTPVYQEARVIHFRDTASFFEDEIQTF